MSDGLVRVVGVWSGLARISHHGHGQRRPSGRAQAPTCGVAGPNGKSWYLYIPEGDLAGYETVTCEMALGSALFINQLTPHRSLENHSDKVRWSVDPALAAPRRARRLGRLSRPCRDAPRGTIRRSRPDWDSFFARRAKAFEGFRNLGKDSFDVSVDGPWIDRWR